MSQTDFQPPGFTLRHRQRHIVAVAFAYSGQHNSRSLENHFHGFWNAVLIDLVDDLGPGVVVIPQFQLDVIDPLSSGLTGDASFSTTAQSDAKELTPDFSIAFFHLVMRATGLPISEFPNTYNEWPTIKVTNLKIPAIAELKRTPTRSAKSIRNFMEDLISSMQNAKESLFNQAEYVFAINPKAKKIILLACCGEWWAWAFVTHENIKARVQVFLQQWELDGNGDDKEGQEDSKDDEDPDENDVFSPRPSKLGDAPRRNLPDRTARTKIPEGYFREPPSPPPSASDKVAYKYNPDRKPATKKNPRNQRSEEETEKKRKMPQKANFTRYTDLGDEMESVTNNVEHAIRPEGQFSRYILFGSAASAQHLFLIHRFLKAELQFHDSGTNEQENLKDEVERSGEEEECDDNVEDDLDIYA